MSFLTFLAERRSHSDQNTEKDDVLETIRTFTEHEKIWMSFVHHPKLGINPINRYETPTAIYSYRLSDYRDNILKNGNLDAIPYQNDSPYIYFFRLKSDRYRILDSETYSREDLDKDLSAVNDFVLEQTKNSHYDYKEIDDILVQVAAKKKSLTSFKTLIMKITKHKTDYLKHLDTSYNKLKIDLPQMNRDLLKIEDQLKNVIAEFHAKYNSFSLADHENKDEEIGIVSDTILAGRKLESLISSIKYEKYDRLSLLNLTHLNLLRRYYKKLLTWDEFLNYYINIELIDKTMRDMALKIKKFIIRYDGYSNVMKGAIPVLQEERMEHAIQWCKDRLKEIDQLPEKQRTKKTVVKERQQYKNYLDLLLQTKNIINPRNKEESLEKIARTIIVRVEQQIKQYTIKTKEIKNAADIIRNQRVFRRYNLEHEQGIVSVAASKASAQQKKLKTNNHLSYLWAYTYQCLPFLSAATTSLNVNIWNMLFRRVLNVGAIVDRGIGFIHQNEPKQTVIFSKEMIDPIKMIRNKIVINKKPPLTADDIFGHTRQLIGYPELDTVRSVLKIWYPNKNYTTFFTDPSILHKVIEQYREHNLEILTKSTEHFRKNGIEIPEHIRAELENSWVDGFLNKPTRYVKKFKTAYGENYWKRIKDYFLKRTQVIIDDVN